jgi:hypothetical protein
MSAAYLAYLLRQSGGQEELALGAYYQGLASMRANGPFPDTREYTKGILAYRALFSR